MTKQENTMDNVYRFSFSDKLQWLETETIHFSNLELAIAYAIAESNRWSVRVTISSYYGEKPIVSIFPTHS